MTQELTEPTSPSTSLDPRRWKALALVASLLTRSRPPAEIPVTEPTIAKETF